MNYLQTQAELNVIYKGYLEWLAPVEMTTDTLEDKQNLLMINKWLIDNCSTANGLVDCSLRNMQRATSALKDRIFWTEGKGPKKLPSMWEQARQSKEDNKQPYKGREAENRATVKRVMTEAIDSIHYERCRNIADRFKAPFHSRTAYGIEQLQKMFKEGVANKVDPNELERKMLKRSADDPYAARHYQPKAKNPKDMTVLELYEAQQASQRKVEALNSIAVNFPLLADTQRNLERITAMVDKAYASIWTVESVTNAIRYIHKNDLDWLQPAPPPQPEPESTFEYDEGPLADWQLPLNSPEFVQRRSTKEQLRDLIERVPNTKSGSERTHNKFSASSCPRQRVGWGRCRIHRPLRHS
jgi:hypothetical protein